MKAVFLRAFEPDDYVLINKWRNDPSIQKLTSGIFRYVSSEREREWVRNQIMNDQTDIYLSICLNNESKEMIGYLSIRNIDHLNRVAFGGGIVIGNKAYRDGTILVESTLIELSYAFDTLNINRFEGSCLEEHKFSRMMMEAFNFKFEGCKRSAIFKNGQYRNIVIYSILREEYYDSLSHGDYDFLSIARKIRMLNKNHKV